MPFSGRNHGSSNIYVHTGDSGMGITNGVAGSLTILPLIIGEDSRYAPLFDPGRKAASIPAATEFVKGQAGAVRNLSEYLRPGDVKSEDDLAPGEGAVAREGRSKIAACTGAHGTPDPRSAGSTPTWCLGPRNTLEKRW